MYNLSNTRLVFSYKFRLYEYSWKTALCTKYGCLLSLCKKEGTHIVLVLPKFPWSCFIINYSIPNEVELTLQLKLNTCNTH